MYMYLIRQVRYSPFKIYFLEKIIFSTGYFKNSVGILQNPT